MRSSLNDQEMEVFISWQKKEREIDSYIGEINCQLDLIDRQALDHRGLLAENKELISRADEGVGKLTVKIETQNKKLKNLVKFYQRPSHCLMDLILLVILGVLIVILMKQITGLMG